MRQNLPARCMTLAIFLLTIIALTGCGQSSSVGEKKEASSKSSPTDVDGKSTSLAVIQQLPQQKDNLLSFTLLKDSSYGDTGTAKVLWEIMVPPVVKKESLTNLLKDLYVQAQSKKFKGHIQPTVISIKAYMSMQQAESGMGQWIGWISKSGGQIQPSLSFDDRQINQLGKKAEEKLGLSEDKRKEIWEEIVRAEDSANKDAEQKYPELNAQNSAVYMDAFQKKEKLAKQLMDKYHNQVAKKYGLTRKQLNEIGNEGLQKSWPFPN